MMTLALAKQVERDLTRLAGEAVCVDAQTVESMRRRAHLLAEQSARRATRRVSRLMMAGLAGLVAIGVVMSLDGEIWSPALTLWSVAFCVLAFGTLATAMLEHGSAWTQVRSERCVWLLEALDPKGLAQAAAIAANGASDDARGLRDAVLARSEPLRRFHLEAMRQMVLARTYEMRALASAITLRDLAMPNSSHAV